MHSTLGTAARFNRGPYWALQYQHTTPGAAALAPWHTHVSSTSPPINTHQIHSFCDCRRSLSWHQLVSHTLLSSSTTVVLFMIQLRGRPISPSISLPLLLKKCFACSCCCCLSQFSSFLTAASHFFFSCCCCFNYFHSQQDPPTASPPASAAPASTPAADSILSLLSFYLLVGQNVPWAGLIVLQTGAQNRHSIQPEQPTDLYNIQSYNNKNPYCRQTEVRRLSGAGPSFAYM